MARILIAEDEEPLRNLVRRALVDAGHDVAAAADGAEALDLINRAKPRFDLLLADIKMPVMDGIALALAAARDYPELIILLMTGYADQRERAHGLDALIHDVIAKPFTLAEIRAAIAAALRDRTGGEGLASALRNEFGVQVGAEPLDAAFAAMAGFLHAAERRLRRRDGDRIDPHHAGFDRLPDRRRGRVGGGERVGGEPELERVRALHHLVEALEGDDRGDRPERLLGHHLGIVGTSVTTSARRRSPGCRAACRR